MRGVAAGAGGAGTITSVRRRQLIIALGCAAAFAALLLTVAGLAHDPGVLQLSPLILLAIPLAGGFPGERRLAAHLECARPASRGARSVGQLRRASRSGVPGGRPIACGWATRPPPALA